MKNIKRIWYWMQDRWYILLHGPIWSAEGVTIEPEYTAPGGRPEHQDWKREGNIYPFERKEPHTVGKAQCTACGCQWIAVVPGEGPIKLECPECGAMEGEQSA